MVQSRGSSSTRLPRKRIAKGAPRPAYLDGADLDRVVVMFVALVSEVLALRDRVETHETLLECAGASLASAVESFVPTPAVDAEREQRRLASMRRIFRVLRDEIEAESRHDTAPGAGA